MSGVTFDRELQFPGEIQHALQGYHSALSDGGFYKDFIVMASKNLSH
jgi:hypothetical protein